MWTHFPNVMSLTTLLRVHNIPLFRSLVKIFSSIGPRDTPWGTLLVTSHQLYLELLTILLKPLGPSSYLPNL